MKNKRTIIIIIIIIIIIVKKNNMKTSLKTGFAQIFSCCPPKMGGCSPPCPPPPAHTPRLTKLKRISSSSSDYVVPTFLGEKKIYPFPELVEDKPEY